MFKHLVAVGLMVLGAGCEKHQPAAAPSGAAATPEPSSKAVDAAQLDAVLAELTQVVRKYSVEQRRVPKNFEELVAGGYLSAVPAAPAGKKFAIGKDLRVTLASQ